MSNPGAKPSIQRWIIVAMIVLALLFSVGAALYVTKGKTLPRSLDVLWTVVFSFLGTWWSRNDRRGGAPAGGAGMCGGFAWVFLAFLPRLYFFYSVGVVG